MTSSSLLAPRRERNYFSRTIRLTIVQRVCDVRVDYVETLSVKIVFVIYSSFMDLGKHFSRYKGNNLIPGLGFFSHESCEGAKINYYIFAFAMIVCGFDPNIGIRTTCEILNWFV